jgi:opacity protein-like surface antigen
VGDLTINTYDPYVAFNAGATGAKMHPYLRVGFGATNYGSVSFTRANGQSGETVSETQFSATWGTGVTVFPSPNVGVRFGVQ